MISLHFQGKPFNTTVIQVYAPTSNAEEAEVEQIYEDLKELLELTPKKDILFIIGNWNVKVEKSRRLINSGLSKFSRDWLYQIGVNDTIVSGKSGFPVHRT